MLIKSAIFIRISEYSNNIGDPISANGIRILFSDSNIRMFVVRIFDYNPSHWASVLSRWQRQRVNVQSRRGHEIDTALYTCTRRPSRYRTGSRSRPRFAIPAAKKKHSIKCVLVHIVYCSEFVPVVLHSRSIKIVMKQHY